MKLNKIVVLSALAGLTLITSCSEDFLVTEPSGVSTEEVVNDVLLQDLNSFQDLLNGAYLELYAGYNNYASHDANGMMSYSLVMDLTCEDIAYTRDAHFFCYDYQLDNRAPNYRRPTYMWIQFYYTITAANDVIAVLKTVEDKTPEIKSMLGQAYGIRAFCYYHLVNLYQHPYSKNPNAPGVPYYSEDPEEVDPSRTPVNKIYEYLVRDLQTAYDYLEGQELNTLQMNKNVVAVLMADVQLFLGDYAKAAQFAVAAQDGVSVCTAEDIMEGFEEWNGMAGILWANDVTDETSYMYASFQSHMVAYGVGYGGAVGYRKGISSDLYNKIADNDVRKAWFGLNDSYNTGGVDFSYETTNNLEIYIQNKFRNASGELNGDYIHMRVEEAYFLAAEAYYLAGDEPSAKANLNAVMSQRIEGYNCTLTGQALYDEICIQKRIELWGEGRRLFDAKRRGETIDRTKSTNHAVDLVSFNAMEPYKADEDYRMIWSIPLSEIDNNDYISDGDQNP